MKETIVKIEKSKAKYKKYVAIVKNKETEKTRKINFGDSRYEQFKDSTGKGHYSSRNHGDERRKRNYFNRHSGIKNKKGAVMKEFRASGGKYTLHRKRPRMVKEFRDEAFSLEE